MMFTILLNSPKLREQSGSGSLREHAAWVDYKDELILVEAQCKYLAFAFFTVDWSASERQRDASSGIVCVCDHAQESWGEYQATWLQINWVGQRIFHWRHGLVPHSNEACMLEPPVTSWQKKKGKRKKRGWVQVSWVRAAERYSLPTNRLSWHYSYTGLSVVFAATLVLPITGPSDAGVVCRWPATVPGGGVAWHLCHV